MKRILIILVVAIMAIGVVFANGSSEASSQQASKHFVVATTTMETVSLDTYTGQRCMILFVDKLNELSGGKLTAEISWGGALGNTAQLFSQVAQGTIAMTMCGFDVLGSLKGAGDTSIFCMPYLFESYDHLHAYVNSDAFRARWKPIEEANNLTLVTDIGPSPSRNLNTKKPVYSVADVKNLKLRVAESPASIAVWKAFGANPVVIAATEVYSALDNNLCDGWENQISAFNTLKTAEVAHYISKIDYVFQGHAVLMNTDLYNSLTDQEKAWLKEALEFAYQHNVDETFGRGDYPRAEEDIKIEQMLANPDFKGIFIPEEELDIDSFKEAAKNMWYDFEGSLFSKGMIDEVLACAPSKN